MNPNQSTTAPAARRRYRPPVGRRSGVGTGTTSLLMIFTVLCFATLAMLSLSTALANQRIQGRGLAHSQGLALARGLAAAQVAQLDAELLALQEAAATADAYLEAAAQVAEEQGWQPQEDAQNFAFVAPVDDANELVTVLRLEAPGAAGRYTVIRQITRLAEGWTPEAGGQLWEGEGNGAE